MVRTADWKCVRYKNEPIEQLFDMKNDAWEMKNLFDDPKYSDVVREHRKLLDQWEAQMIPAPRVASLEITGGGRS
jgi:arylsulfatase A-like enzyme